MRETSYKKGRFRYFRNNEGQSSKSTAVRRNIVLGTGETDLNEEIEICKLDTAIDVQRRRIA
jgi:hypothetical protein